MATFPRDLTDSSGKTILPVEAEWPTSPPPMLSPGMSGKDQVRSTTQRGYLWRERYGLMRANDPAVRKLFSLVRTYHREGTTLDVEHVSIVLLGAGGGTPLVAGADQTGATIDTDGWPNSTAILKVGDFVRFGTGGAHEITANVSSGGTGLATLAITPPIFVGSSPLNNATVYLGSAGVALFRARIIDVTWPAASSKQSSYYSGMTLTFKEVL